MSDVQNNLIKKQHAEVQQSLEEVVHAHEKLGFLIANYVSAGMLNEVVEVDSSHDDFKKPQWLSMVEASWVVGCNKGTITRWVKEGHLITNNLSGRNCRILSLSLIPYLLERGKERVMNANHKSDLNDSELRESNEHVEQLFDEPDSW
jgi:hypothetical protein